MAVTGASSPTSDLQRFADEVLAGIGAPASTQNVDWIVSWSRAEASTAANNPLDTTLHTSGSYALPGNSAGVQQYPSETAGVAATVATLKGGNYYPELVKDFQKGNIISSYQTDPSLLSQLETWGGGASYWAAVASNASQAAGGGSLPAGSGAPSPGPNAGGTSTGPTTQPVGFFSSPLGTTEALAVRAIFGIAGIALLVVALILISKAVTSRNVVSAGAGFLAGRTEQKRKQERAQVEETRASERHETTVAHARARTKTEQARATELRTRQKNRRRTRREQEEAERRSYIRGATDQAGESETSRRSAQRRASRS